MGTLVSDKFHLSSAKAFVDSLSDANTNYYLFIGHPTPWANGAPTPTDAGQQVDFAYWADAMALVRIRPDSVMHVAPRHDWTANSIYSMYDHRVSAAIFASNTAYPYYVTVNEMGTYRVFKCLFNGQQTGNLNSASVSTGTPSIIGQADVTTLTVAAGTPTPYVWKYLYTIDAADEKFLTNDYMPVRNVGFTGNGDITNDATGRYLVFDAARSAGNGSIEHIVVDSAGSNYANTVEVIVHGDGDGAQAVVELTANTITAVRIVSGGRNYSRAFVTFVNGGSGTGANATPIISPRGSFANGLGTFYITNHGINLVDELNASRVMIYARLSGTGNNNVLPVDMTYARVGIVKNPILRANTNAGAVLYANADSYSMTTDLALTGVFGTFPAGELVYQPASNAYGVVVSLSGTTLRLTHIRGSFLSTGNTYVVGIGNGNASGHSYGGVTIPPAPEAFSPVIPASGASGFVQTVTLPSVKPYTGDVIYVNQMEPITRTSGQAEVIRTVLAF